MYRIIGKLNTRAFRIAWMLEELGVDYKIEPVVPRSDIARGFNPSGKVPVLMVDDVAIIDSVAAIQFLADSHGLMSDKAGTLGRATQDSFTQFINDEFDAVLWTNARYEWNLPEKYQINAVRDGQIFLYEKALRTLETRFTNAPYLMGAQLSVPDIVLIQCLGWARVSRFESPKSEKIRAYIKTCISRPAYQRADRLRQEMGA